jgi:hypothetical protein
MDLPSDFKALLALFNANGVESRSQLIANKRATGRAQDLADLEALGEDAEK